MTRGRVCRLHLLLALASAVILGSESQNCLRFKASILEASYDSQNYGGGIRPRLHTGETWAQSQSQSQSHIATDGRSVSQLSLGVEHHLGLMTRYLLLFDS
jgi:hypothetical protein